LAVSSATDSGRLAPFQVRVAAQGAQAGAGRVHQHPVELAGQALHLGVPFVGDEQALDVGQPGAGQARLQFGQALFRHVEGIEAAGAVHQGAQQQGLAAGAGAEVAHHLAPARRQQEAQQLAALVLDFEAAVQETRMFLQGRLALQADAQGRVGRGGGGQAFAVPARPAGRRGRP
jgi:hypothetical protein